MGLPVALPVTVRADGGESFYRQAPQPQEIIGGDIRRRVSESHINATQLKQTGKYKWELKESIPGPI